jgi:U3 small nucleolar ribonucleoprotein component
MGEWMWMWMRQVSRELDALSHFFFTPRPVPREESALTSLPVESLQMEDITPVGESRAAALAPEQVRLAWDENGMGWDSNGYFFLRVVLAQVAAKKSGRAAALVADEELTREDRQRLRRAAKSSAKKDK